jgi:hypothetical protein
LRAQRASSFFSANGRIRRGELHTLGFNLSPPSAIFRAFMPSPEELAREKIDALLMQCGWIIQNRSTINLSASRGVAIREALLKDRDEVDYLLFVDRGKQTLIPQRRDQQFVTPDDGRKFTELYNVQHLQSSQLDRVSRVCISTIQRLYSMLRFLFFWYRNTDAARRDRREETGGALCALNEAGYRYSFSSSTPT